MNDMKEIKLLTLGNSKVGKSSFILRYTDDEFSLHISTTIGMDYKSKISLKKSTAIKTAVSLRRGSSPTTWPAMCWSGRWCKNLTRKSPGNAKIWKKDLDPFHIMY